MIRQSYTLYQSDPKEREGGGGGERTGRLFECFGTVGDGTLFGPTVGFDVRFELL